MTPEHSESLWQRRLHCWDDIAFGSSLVKFFANVLGEQGRYDMLLLGVFFDGLLLVIFHDTVVVQEKHRSEEKHAYHNDGKDGGLRRVVYVEVHLRGIERERVWAPIRIQGFSRVRPRGKDRFGHIRLDAKGLELRIVQIPYPAINHSLSRQEFVRLRKTTSGLHHHGHIWHVNAGHTQLPIDEHGNDTHELSVFNVPHLVEDGIR
mmetsp:Transcript_71426/g.107987  ORF Transcript_71426/g.107987 Transcript_71426/m.107987 type:complete len:206 (+) Transcript_71426:1820-2437(+)